MKKCLLILSVQLVAAVLGASYVMANTEKPHVYINPGHLLALPPDGHFSGLNNVVTDETIKDGKMYDIMGREISQPRRGEIYIKNGQKMIEK